MGQGCCGSRKPKKVDSGVDYNTVMEIAQTTGMEMMELREYYAEFLKVLNVFLIAHFRDATLFFIKTSKF